MPAGRLSTGKTPSAKWPPSCATPPPRRGPGSSHAVSARAAAIRAGRSVEVGRRGGVPRSRGDESNVSSGETGTIRREGIGGQDHERPSDVSRVRRFRPARNLRMRGLWRPREDHRSLEGACRGPGRSPPARAEPLTRPQAQADDPDPAQATDPGSAVLTRGEVARPADDLVRAVSGQAAERFGWLATGALPRRTPNAAHKRTAVALIVTPDGFAVACEGMPGNTSTTASAPSRAARAMLAPSRTRPRCARPC